MIDFISLCKELKLPYLEEGHHHCHEGWIQTHCPFCSNGEYGWHLGVNKEEGNMNCWRCGKHNIREWLKTVLPSSVNINSIISKYSIKTIIPRKNKEIIVRKKNIVPPPGTSKMLKIHHEYLTNRGFPSEYLEKVWRLQGTTAVCNGWKWRLVADVCDPNTRVVAYAGRALSPKILPRWKMTDKEKMGCDPRKLIYGIHKTDFDKGVLIVEGISDVWRMGINSVGLLGIDWKIEQANILRKFKRRFIMFDNEPLAQKKAKELAYWLAPFPGETIILSDIKTDPGDLLQKEADSIMKDLNLRKKDIKRKK